MTTVKKTFSARDILKLIGPKDFNLILIAFYKEEEEAFFDCMRSWKPRDCITNPNYSISKLVYVGITEENFPNKEFHELSKLLGNKIDKWPLIKPTNN